jgi:uncharacterized protein YgiM (DUF1202 family)
MRRLALIAMVAIVAVTALAARQKQMSVQVQNAQLRSAPTPISRVLATVGYTEKVTILEEKGDWNRVQFGTTEGWMSKGSLTTRKLTIDAGGPDAALSVTSDEQGLAGKGFNSDVEKQFKERNKEADFATVDRMEKITVSDLQIQQFIKDGKLAVEGGAQ